MDETCVTLTPKPIPGLVLGPKGQRVAHASSPGIRVQKHMTRSALTYVATIASLEAVQQVLPHFLVSSRRLLPNRVLETILLEAPQHVHVLRRRSAWMTSCLAETTLGILSEAIEPFKAEYEIILIWDVCPSHSTFQVMRVAERHGIRLVFVPANLTASLQPLDLCCFKTFKSWVQEEFQRLRTIGHGEVSVLEWMRLLCRAPEAVFRRNWHAAFALVGATGEPLQLSNALKELRCKFPPHPCEAPSLAELAQIFPRSRTMSYARDLLFPMEAHQLDSVPIATLD